MDRRPLVLALALALSAALTSTARADVLVAFDKVVPGQGFDIDVRDLQQDGAPVKLPPGLNTAADEFHPTLSGDGRLLSFERDALANTPGPERPPIYNKQLVVVDLHAGRIVTPPAFQFSDALRTTPSLSSDGRWEINGNAPFRNSSAFATLTDLTTGASAQVADELPPPPPSGPAACADDICVPPGAQAGDGTISIPPDAVPVTGQTTSVLNPGAGPGAAPLLAWTRYRLTHFGDGSTGASVDLRVHRPGLDFTVPHASNQFFGHPSVFGSNLVSFESIPVTSGGIVGNGDIYAVDAAGHVSRTLPQVNTAADERKPVWSRDGRYLAFVRRGADGHDRVLLFDFANNLLVDPAGLDLGAPPADSRPLGESLALQGGISIADDPTAKTDTIFLLQPRLNCTSLKGGTLSCKAAGTTVLTQKTTTVGILVRRVLGTQNLFGRSVPKLGPQIRVPLGTHRGRFHVDARVPAKLRAGRYLLTARTFRADGRVRTLAPPRVVTVR